MRGTHKKIIPAAVVAALSAALAGTALGATATSAAAPKIKSLTVTPTTVHHGKSTLVVWELNRAATTTIQVGRCQNSTCTIRTPVGKTFKRLGALGLNSMRLTLRVTPGRYAVLATAGKSSRKALVKVVK